MNRVLSAIWSVFTVQERRNVLVLAICQTLFGAGRTLLVATAALVALSFAEHKGLATLPAALVVVGTAAASYPASMLMRRVGRRAGFVIGSLIGGAGGVVCMIGIVEEDFWTFTIGNLIFGFFSGFAQLYRFAAADTASREFRSTAISLVLVGGVVASVVGAEFSKIGEHMFADARFLGSYLFLLISTLLSALVLMFLNIPPLTAAQAAQKQRPLGSIVIQPTFVAATASVLIAHSVMAMLMTAAPLAMAHSHHEFEATAWVIMWHSLGMFGPAFVTGWFIKKVGEIAIIFTGFGLQFVCVAVALSGEAVFDYWLSMLLLGVGWNFAFTAGTTLLAGAYTPAERNKAQGASNFVAYTFIAIGALSSGALFHFFGWGWVNITALPALAVAVAIMVWFTLSGRNREPSLDAA